MQVHVSSLGVTVLDGTELTSLSVASELDRGATVTALVSSGVARSADADHVWLDVAELARLARPAGHPEWGQGFDAMIGYAASRGWTDPEASIVRAHLEEPS